MQDFTHMQHGYPGVHALEYKNFETSLTVLKKKKKKIISENVSQVETSTRAMTQVI